MARLSGTVSRYQDRECADTHRSCDLHISHSRGRPRDTTGVSAGPAIAAELQGLFFFKKNTSLFLCYRFMYNIINRIF